MYTSPNMGLTIWNLATDLYDHNAQANNLVAMDQHNHTVGQGVQIPTGGIANAAITGAKLGTNAVDIANLTLALSQSAVVNQGSQTVKSALVNAGTGTRTNTAYGNLSDAADQVANIVLPTNGLITVWYQATWQESVGGAARAAIFIGGNQMQIQSFDLPGPGTEAAAIGGTAATNRPLFSSPLGLVSGGNPANSGADVTTGQAIGAVSSGSANTFTYEQAGTVKITSTGTQLPGVLGGPCHIFAAAGTYNVSVQFKASSGTVTASNRKLWVQAISFA